MRIALVVALIAAGCGGSNKQPASGGTGEKLALEEGRMGKPERASEPAPEPAPDGAGTGSGGEVDGTRSHIVPEVVIGEEEVQGAATDPTEVRRVVKTGMNKVRYCYERQLMVNPNLAGTVRVQFTIIKTGAVSTSKILSSTLADKTAEDCIAAAVATWVFPKPQGGGSVVVTYPFTFKPE